MTDAAADDDALRARLAPLWPAMVERLGARWPEFAQAVRDKAALRGLTEPACVLRYAGLALAFGPGFEERPENEWALAVLADERLPRWTALHQLVRRAAEELTRRGGDAGALQRADAALIDALDAGRGADAEPLPRVACDLEAVELRLHETAWRREYRRVEATWQRVPIEWAERLALRVHAAQPAPGHVHVLIGAAGAPAARLVLRQVAHGGCGERHPEVTWIDMHGLTRWRGAEARALGVAVPALAQAPADNGLDAVLFAEPGAAVHVLRDAACGLRDDGVPLGALQLEVRAWPATQWLAAWQREPGAERHLPPAAGAAPPPAAATRCRLERDGAALPVAGWQRGFDVELAQQLDAGLARLHEAWSQSAREARLHAAPALLAGRAVLAWGLREGEPAMTAAPLLRAVADLDLVCGLELRLEGEIESGASRTRVRLAAAGSAPLQQAFVRERQAPSLAETLLPAVLDLRFPFALDWDPIATAEGVICCEAGPCTGAVVGKAGLRPRPSGGGWQWFVRLAVEPVLAPVALHDPVLGQTRRTLALLPAVPLVDWSLG